MKPTLAKNSHIRHIDWKTNDLIPSDTSTGGCDQKAATSRSVQVVLIPLVQTTSYKLQRTVLHCNVSGLSEQRNDAFNYFVV